MLAFAVHWIIWDCEEYVGKIIDERAPAMQVFLSESGTGSLVDGLW